LDPLERPEYPYPPRLRPERAEPVVVR